MGCLRGDVSLVRSQRFLAVLLLLGASANCAHRVPVEAVPRSEPREVPPPGREPVSGPEPPAIPPGDVPDEDLLPPLEPRHGGEIRFFGVDLSAGNAFVRSNVAEGLVPGGLLLAWRKPEGGSTCWILELTPNSRYPDGATVSAGDVARSWIDAAARGGEDAAWLLEPFEDRAAEGQSGSIASAIHATGQVLEACPRRPTPDLPERLAHPALWFSRGNGGASPSGPGPFYPAADGALHPNPNYAGPGPYVDRLEQVAVEGDPTVPLRLGDAHVAIVFGKVASALLADPGPSELQLSRLPEWDRTYYLWMNPAKRWVNDPQFRSWISQVAGREEMVSYLFEGQAEPTLLLSPGSFDAPRTEPVPRPISASSVPRIELTYDAGDGYSETLARRIQAVLETKKVAITLDRRSTAELRDRLERQDVEMALLDHRPASSDPLLGLLQSVYWLGSHEGREALSEACSTIDPAQPELRREAAWSVERELLDDWRIVPLIRLHAWLARHPRLTGTAPGPDGVLRLEEAWWLP